MKNPFLPLVAVIPVLVFGAENMEQILQEQRRAAADYSAAARRLAADLRDGRLSQEDYAARLGEVNLAFAATNADIRARWQEAAAQLQLERQKAASRRMRESRERAARPPAKTSARTPDTAKEETPNGGEADSRIPEQELESAIRERRILDIGRWIEDRKTTAEDIERIQRRIDSEKSEEELKAAIRENRLADIAKWIQRKETTADAVTRAQAAVDAERRNGAGSEPDDPAEPESGTGATVPAPPPAPGPKPVRAQAGRPTDFANCFRETGWNLFHMFAPEAVRATNVVYSHSAPATLLVRIVDGIPIVVAERRTRRAGYTLEIPLVSARRYVQGEALETGDYMFEESHDELSALSPVCLRALSAEESAMVDMGVQERAEKAARKERERLLADQAANSEHAAAVLAEMKLYPMDYILVQKSLRRHVGTPELLTKKWQLLEEARRNQGWLKMLSILAGKELELFPARRDTDALISRFLSENCSVRFRTEVPSMLYPAIWRLSTRAYPLNEDNGTSLVVCEFDQIQTSYELNWHDGGGILTFKPSEAPFVIANTVDPFHGTGILEQPFLREGQFGDFHEKIERGEWTAQEAHDLSAIAARKKEESIRRWLETH